MYRYLIVDGMVSGTGIRDQHESGYIEPESLGISPKLIEILNNWHHIYKEQFYNNYSDENKIKELDIEGIEISKAILSDLENCKVSYFSDANLKTHNI